MGAGVWKRTGQDQDGVAVHDRVCIVSFLKKK